MIWTEWDKLKEIIVGNVYDPNDFVEYAKDLEWADNEFVDGMCKIFQETRDDLNHLTNILRSYGVKVHRPKNLKLTREQSRMWKSLFPYPGICPRDMHVSYGNTILSTIGGDPNRFNESDFFTQTMLEKYREGRNLIGMPRPLLDDEYKDYEKLEGQILFHAANILKCGDALLHTIPYGDGRQGRGTFAGLDWIKRNLGYDVQWLQIPRSGHADGRLALIKPGVVLVRDRSMIPKELSNWSVVEIDHKPVPKYFTEMQNRGFYRDYVKTWLNTWIGYVEETTFDLNGLSIDPNTFITTGYDKSMTAKMKTHGVEVIPFNFRHRYFFDSGLHCVTLDLAREGSQERYI